MSDPKSCFTCAHWKDESTKQTCKEPAFFEWSCEHPNTDSFPYEYPDDEILGDANLFAEYLAKDCPGYQFKDWTKYEKQQAIALAESNRAKNKAATEMYRATYKSLGINLDSGFEDYVSEKPDMNELDDMYGNDF